MEFILREQFSAGAEEIFSAWLNSKTHSAMTGGPASISPSEGAKFTAWDGYIEGVILKLVPNERIICSWRTSDFEEDQEDSIVEIRLEPSGNRTEFTLQHKRLTDADHHYMEGWQQHYFIPMHNYFKLTERK